MSQLTVDNPACSRNREPGYHGPTTDQRGQIPNSRQTARDSYAPAHLERGLNASSTDQCLRRRGENVGDAFSHTNSRAPDLPSHETSFFA